MAKASPSRQTITVVADRSLLEALEWAVKARTKVSIGAPTDIDNNLQALALQVRIAVYHQEKENARGKAEAP